MQDFGSTYYRLGMGCYESYVFFNPIEMLQA